MMPRGFVPNMLPHQRSWLFYFLGALLTLPFLLQGIDSFSTALELGSPTHLLLWEDPLPSLDSPSSHSGYRKCLRGPEVTILLLLL